VSEEMELEACYEYMELHPEVRPAIARSREPVLDEDGFVTHHEMREKVCAVHTLQVGRGGWVCEFEDGTVGVVPHENVRFVDE
jgi:hypothetical protein